MKKTITVLILALLLLLSICYVWKKIETKKEGSNQMVYDHKKEASEIKASGIRAKMCDNISEEFKKLIKEQVTRWSFHNTGKGGVETFDGQFIPFSDGYNDQRKDIFFNHIKSFIEDVIKRKIEETVELAKDKKVPLSMVLGSTEANLSGGIDTVYHKMQGIDRRLRGGGYPESVPKRDMSFEIKKMNEFLDRQIKIAEDLHFGIPEAGKKKPFYKKAWFWIISTLTFLALLSSLILDLGNIKEKYFPKEISKKEKPTHDKTMNSNIFAEVSKDGEILRANNFPWKIKKTKNKEGDILYSIIDRSGDATAVSVIPDTPKYTVYRSYDGMVIKYTCTEEQISNFTIKVKY